MKSWRFFFVGNHFFAGFAIVVSLECVCWVAPASLWDLDCLLCSMGRACDELCNLCVIANVWVGVCVCKPGRVAWVVGERHGKRESLFVRCWKMVGTFLVIVTVINTLSPNPLILGCETYDSGKLGRFCQKL